MSERKKIERLKITTKIKITITMINTTKNKTKGIPVILKKPFLN